MEGKNFERELPQGYVEAKVVDAKNKGFAILMNVAALLIMTCLIVVGAFLIFLHAGDRIDQAPLIPPLAVAVGMIVYIVLHELVHGIAYKLTTHEKLSFGLTLTAAYCGVPNIYVYRRASLIALLSPFLLFTVIFGVAIFAFSGLWDKLMVLILFSLHVGGCVGDLYDTCLYLFKFRDPGVLMRDSGPKQIFYVKANTKESI